MNRKLLNGFLVLAVATGGVVTFTSCKDEDFRSNTLLTETSLQAQIDAIRSVSNEQFQVDLEKWLNDWTNQLSSGGFKDYEEMVKAANALNAIYQAIMSDTLTPEAEAYVEALYNWMFNQEISAADWYNYIYDLAGRATSVEVAEVVNPIFGSVKLPLDVKSTILATYVYESGLSYSFPADALKHIGPDSPFSSEEVTGAWQDLISGLNAENAVTLENGMFTDATDLGNMGGSVITINPSSNDYTDTDKYTVEIVNSKGEVAFTNAVAEEDDEDAPAPAAETSAMNPGSLVLEEYDGLLSFGHHRSGDAPGVYSLKVNAPETGYGFLKVDVDKSGLKDAVKKLIDNKTIANATNLARTVWDNLNNQLPAYSVRVSWEEPVIDPATGKAEEEPIVNSVYSDFELAAVVAHPLGYTTDIAGAMGGLVGKKIPVIHNPITDYIQRLQDRIMRFSFELDELDTDIEIEFNVEIRNGYVYFKVYNEDGELSEDYKEVEIKYTDGGINASDADLTALVQAIQDAMSQELSSGIQYKMMKQLNDQLQKVNDEIMDVKNKAYDYLDRLKNDNKLRYAQKLVDIYNEIAEKAQNFINDPNHYLQITMGYYENGIHHMSNDMKMGTPFPNSGKLDLVTTSYTADLVVPSFKKYVAITGVATTGQTDFSTSGLADLNSKAGLNKVFAGQTEKTVMDLSALEVGKTYRLTYISVDYHGMCSMENYYLQIK